MCSWSPRLVSFSHTQTMDTNEERVAVQAGLRQFIVGRRNRAGAPGVCDDRTGPECGVFSCALILIPAAAAAGLPDSACQAAMDVSDKLLLLFWTHFEDVLLGAFHEGQTTHHIADLRFDHKDDGIVAKSGIGAEQQKEVGKAADGHAEIRTHALAPGIVDFHAAAADNPNADERLRGAKACAKNQNVDWTLDAVLRHDAVLAHFRDPARDQLSIGPCQCGIVIIRHEDALAAQFIVRFQRRAQFWVANLLLEMMCRDFRCLPANKAIAKEAKHAKLLPPENELPKRPHDQWETAESPLPFFRNRKIHARNDPGRGALEKIKLSSTRSDLRNKLDGACTSADDSYALAIQVDAVIPSGRMKFRAHKTLNARELGILRHVQTTDSRDEHLRADAHPLTGGSVPQALCLIPNGFVKTRIQPDVGGEFVALDAAFQIIVNFLLAGIHARPIRRWLEGKGIQMRRNVAGATGITVVVPSSTDVVALFDNQKRIHTSFAKLDGHAQSGETAADNEYVNADFFGRADLVGTFRHRRSRYLVRCFRGSNRA